MTRTLFLSKPLMASALLSATLLGCGNDPGLDEYGDPIATDVPHVAVTQIVEHPALDAVRDGVQDKLKEEG
ncbi:MAG: ABC transporter substrate binding protein, partial [Cyanobacteria bacterium J06607_17]